MNFNENFCSTTFLKVLAKLQEIFVLKKKGKSKRITRCAMLRFFHLL